MLSFRGKPDHGSFAQVADFDALGNAAALVEQLGDASSSRAQLFAEVLSGLATT